MQSLDWEEVDKRDFGHRFSATYRINSGTNLRGILKIKMQRDSQVIHVGKNNEIAWYFSVWPNNVVDQRGEKPFLVLYMSSCNYPSKKVRLYGHMEVRRGQPESLPSNSCLITEDAILEPGCHHLLCTNSEVSKIGLFEHYDYSGSENVGIRITLNAVIVPSVSAHTVSEPSTETTRDLGIKWIVDKRQWKIKASIKHDGKKVLSNGTNTLTYTVFGDDMETLTWKLLFWRMIGLTSDKHFLSLQFAESNLPGSVDVAVLYHVCISQDQCSTEFPLCLKPPTWTHTMVRVGDFIDLCTRDQVSTISRDRRTISELNLIITCTLDIELDTKESCARGISRDILPLLHDSRFSDVVFVVDGKELPAHKCIIVRRSPVFEAMFCTEMKENSENRVEIKDIAYDVFKQLLTYVYTNQVSNIDDIAKELFEAADKYSLLKLRDICEEAACANVSSETVVSDLVYAVLHNGSKLKSRAIKFIKENKDEVLQTSDWKKFREENPKMLLEIFDDFV